MLPRYAMMAMLLGVLVAGCSSPDSPTHPAASATASAVNGAIGTGTSADPASATVPASTANVQTNDPTEGNVTDTQVVPEETATVVPEPTETVDPAVAAADFQTMANELVAGVDGLAEVVVALPDGTSWFSANAGEPMESASLYKLPIVVEAFRLREVGAISFDQQIELLPEYFYEEDSVYGEESIGAYVDIATLLEYAVTLSSNVAAKALLAMAGNDAINDTMQTIGLTGTAIRWSPGYVGLPSGDEAPVGGRKLASIGSGGSTGNGALGDARADEALNVTTADDMALLFRLIVNGELFSPQASQDLLELLERQQINDRLPAYLPEGTTVAHKTGNLDGLVHDVGVIFAPQGPVVVVCLLETWDEGYAVELIREIAAGAYELGS